jgi:glucosamine 6-phosphate synthetase-like amidotransferase/phosphosugar isomerase protein
MCGIVGYFGSSPNGLVHVLGGMSAILYRAPDSTGAAWFGDERETIRLRKAELAVRMQDLMSVFDSLKRCKFVLYGGSGSRIWWTG